jgi:Kef-type K+ transport system membrane component KefB
MPSLDGLLIVVAVAFSAPFALGLVPRLRIPAVVLEIVAGIVVGPSVLGWVEPDATITVMAALGLAFLLFLGGLEVDFAQLRGRVLRRTAGGYAVSLALALAVSVALGAAGLVQTPLLVAIALGSTSLGVLIPVLKDGGQIRTPLGRLVLAGGSLADFAAIILLSLLFTGEGGAGATLVLIGALVGLAAVVLVVVRGAQHSLRIRADLHRLQDTTAQIRVRGALVLLVGLAAAAERLGLEVILGAFAAGAILALGDPDRGMTHPDFRRKLEAVGFGVFIPIFFVTSGVRFDLGALAASGSALAMVPLFLLALLLARGLPALLYRPLLDRRETLVAGLLQATSLPFLVAATAIGREAGLIGAGEAAALIAAGLLSVLLFPAAALALLRPPTHHHPKGTAMPTSCSAYGSDTDAYAAVDRLLAAGTPGARITVLTGHVDDARTHEAMGTFAAAGRRAPRGSFGAADRDEIATFRDGVRRAHVASHRELERVLGRAGLDASAVGDLHHGRVLVLVDAA